MNSIVVIIVVVWILFKIEVYMNDFDICCWVGENFGVDVVVWKFILLRECPFDRKVVEVGKQDIIRRFGVVDCFG